MRAWMTNDPPHLPGRGGGRVLVHDTLSGQLQPAGPAEGTARLYACGITPYDATHLGHAATYVAVDLLNRAWLDAGLEVRYAQNITDVDDPLLDRAAATGVDWTDLAERQIELYRTDMAALRVLPPEPFTGVVESLDLVTSLISVLHAEQAVYQVPDPEYPDWYFSITKASNLMDGTGISMLEADQVFAERGGDPERPGKRHRLDCLVWRQERPGEPAWDSWLGRGRPGWHIECTAIALDALGSDFDVQAGGSDLSFPHHPMCAAEARVATGHRFAKVFLHTGMVALVREQAAGRRNRPDGDPARAARPPLPQRLGVHGFRARGRAGPARPLAQGCCRRLRSRRHRNSRCRPCPPAPRPRRPCGARIDR
jgi:L-cysteine:1D-myo-inositol 2-amino-2-deoxy-alpha-D-glucopyranoside ligase